MEEITKVQTTKDLVDTGLCCSNALLSVINDILNISKLEAGMKSISESEPGVLKLFQPSGIVHEVSTILSSVMHEKGLLWSTIISTSVQPYLIGYPVRIRQILLNLAANAIKFMDQGKITVTMSCYDTSLAQLHEMGVDILQERVTSKLPPPSSPSPLPLVPRERLGVFSRPSTPPPPPPPPLALGMLND